MGRLLHRPLSLSQQLSLLLVALMLVLQIMMVLIDRIHDLDEARMLARDQTPSRLFSMVRKLQTLPEEAHPEAARALSDPLSQYFVRDVPGLHPTDRRDTKLEVTARTWLRDHGLEPHGIRAAQRVFKEHLSGPPPGIPARRSAVLSLGTAPKTILRANTHVVPSWVSGDWAAYDPQGLIPATSHARTGPPRTSAAHRPASFPPASERQAKAEVYTLAVQLQPDGPWITVYSLMNPPPLNVSITKLGLTILGSIVLTSGAVLVGRRIIAPLRDLGEATARLGRTDPGPPVPLRGPRELRDITATFNQMNARLGQAMDYQSALLHSLAHDLKAPLFAARRMLGTVEPVDTRARIQTCLSSVDDTLTAITAFSKAVLRDGELEPVDLAALVQTLVDEQTDFGADARAETPARLILSCRAQAMERCVRNLVGNALKYGGSVEVLLSSSGETAVLQVLDRGPGIPQEALSEIFRPFFRFTDQNEGSGLGLSIVKAIALDHGGEITLRNRMDGGLVAELRLPMT